VQLKPKDPGRPIRHRLAFVLALFFVLPLTAQAHKPSDSYLNIKIDGSQITGQWDLALRDLDFVIGIDENGDGDVTWGELKSQQPEIEKYLLDKLTIKVNGRASLWQVTEHLVDTHLDDTYAVLRFTVQNSDKPRFLQIDYRTFFDFDAQHRGLLRLEYEGQTQMAIFSIQEQSHLFEVSKPNRLSECLAFVWEGIWHIWIGFDHILFLIALLLPAVLKREDGRWHVVESFGSAFVNVIKIVTAFTVAHSLTLGLAAFEIIELPARWVESVIAASVVLAALHNFYPVLKAKSWMVAFVFGLIHGFGFANVLGELGLGQGTLLVALVGFNVGVELGQLAIVSGFLPLAYAFRSSWLYRGVALRLGSALIVLIAAVWMFERMFDMRLLGF